MAVIFESLFDVGDAVQHYITKEKFYIRFVAFGALGEPVYSCYTKYNVGKPNDLYTFDEAELEPVMQDED